MFGQMIDYINIKSLIYIYKYIFRLLKNCINKIRLKKLILNKFTVIALYILNFNHI